MSRNQRVHRTVGKNGWVVLVFALSIPFNLAKLAAEASGFSESSAAGIGLVAIVTAGVFLFVICQELPPDR